MFFVARVGRGEGGGSCHLLLKKYTQVPKYRLLLLGHAFDLPTAYIGRDPLTSLLRVLVLSASFAYSRIVQFRAADPPFCLSTSSIPFLHFRFACLFFLTSQLQMTRHLVPRSTLQYPPFLHTQLALGLHLVRIRFVLGLKLEAAGGRAQEHFTVEERLASARR